MKYTERSVWKLDLEYVSYEQLIDNPTFLFLSLKYF